MSVLTLLLCTYFKEKNELPPVPPELQEDAEESTRLAKERQRDVVSDESGRTLAVTLHEVHRYSVVVKLGEHTR